MPIAIVEDEKKLAESLKEGLLAEGYAVDVFHDAESVEEKILNHSFEYSMILLDLMLPFKSGLELCRVLRANNINTPILVLTARDSIEDKIVALDSGVDDFVTKPFSFDELLARVRALRRRTKSVKKTVLTIGEVTLDSAGRQVFRKDKNIALTLREFDILQYLMERKGQVVHRDELFSALWDISDVSLSNVVDVHVSNLRKKIDDEFDKKILRTVRGLGYSVQE